MEKLDATGFASSMFFLAMLFEVAEFPVSAGVSKILKIAHISLTVFAIETEASRWNVVFRSPIRLLPAVILCVEIVRAGKLILIFTSLSLGKMRLVRIGRSLWPILPRPSLPHKMPLLIVVG